MSEPKELIECVDDATNMLIIEEWDRYDKDQSGISPRHITQIATTHNFPTLSSSAGSRTDQLIDRSLTVVGCFRLTQFASSLISLSFTFLVRFPTFNRSTMKAHCFNHRQKAVLASGALSFILTRLSHAVPRVVQVVHSPTAARAAPAWLLGLLL